MQLTKEKLKLPVAIVKDSQTYFFSPDDHLCVQLEELTFVQCMGC